MGMVVGVLEECSTDVAERLYARRSEIEESVFARVRGVRDPADRDDAEHIASQRATVAAVVDYVLRSIGREQGQLAAIPPQAAAWAGRVAREGVSLGTVLRRYIAGSEELGEFIAEEAERGGFVDYGPALRRMHRALALQLERLTAVVEDAYNQELLRMGGSSERRRAEIARRLLVGESASAMEMAELNYEVDALWHLALIATGPAAERVLGRLRGDFGNSSLLVACDGVVWAWLGGRQRAVLGDAERLLAANRHGGISMGIGEPASGVDGWRLTHRQARAALSVALRKSRSLVWYGEDPLLAAALQNDTLAQSLTHKYLAPLRGEQNGGVKLCKTLRAYIDAECNTTSAASSLGVGRRSVESRLRTAERLIGRPLRTCLAELDVALRLEDLDDFAIGAPCG
jgi:PucR C-terminal helix-turn-helix domain/GGDEF-like domain